MDKYIYMDRQQIDKLTKGKKIGRMIDRRYRQMDRQIDINKDRQLLERLIGAQIDR